MTSSSRRTALWWAGALGLVLGAAWGRAWWSARHELRAATRLEAGGQLKAALERYQWAARWYTPGATAPREATEALWRLGVAAEARGDRGSALAALRRLRGAILATRHLWSPFGARLNGTNEHLAALMASAQLEAGGPTLAGRDRAALRADHLALLRLDPTPTPAASLLVVLSFLGWIAAGFLTIARGLDAEAHLVRPAFPRYAGLTALLFGLWIVGLRIA